MQPAPNLVLIGFMASGKSTVGKRSARRLGLPFCDSDALVEQAAGRTVAEIFRHEGEAAFRERETAAIEALSARGPLVLSTGGGAPMNPRNAAILRDTGVVVLLWAEPEAILARVGDPASRPLLASAHDPAARVRELLAVRAPVYRSVAHAVVDTTELTLPAVVDRVLAAYRAGAELFRERRELCADAAPQASS